MPFSKFHKRYTEESGIVRLMEDLGDAMSGQQDILMLGGGNPAHIPEVQQFFQERLLRIAHDPVEFAHIVGNYDNPQGERKFLEALAGLCHDQYGWDIGPENIALTNGSQSAFFALFNMFAGEYESGSHKKILLPLTPEYIGYSDVCIADDCFIAHKPDVEILDDHLFKYHVNFEQLVIDSNTGALCVSRPTNPSGNVLTDEEMARLAALASANNIPFIIDNAYGVPFPDIIYTNVSLYWDQNIILCMSLSKLGLPGVRTGIVIAREEIVSAITKMNAIFSLSIGSFGPALAIDTVITRDILNLSKNVIRPYYQRKARFATDLLMRELADVEYLIHKVEGAIFIWLWLPGFPVSCEELYRRLKSRGVLIIPGQHFFPGLQEDWRHKHECIRISFAMHDTVVERGIRIIADEVKKIINYQGKL
jgi:valine--pyruvate aminotransferase